MGYFICFGTGVTPDIVKVKERTFMNFKIVARFLLPSDTVRLHFAMLTSPRDYPTILTKMISWNWKRIVWSFLYAIILRGQCPPHLPTFSYVHHWWFVKHTETGICFYLTLSIISVNDYVSLIFIHRLSLNAVWK